MKCLVCSTENLEEIEITDGLKVQHCNKCGGNWMNFSDYFHWHNKNKIDFDTNETCCDNYSPVEDSSTAKLCPNCEQYLRPYRVSSELNFSLEHCNCCNGIWFDKNEWENIKKNKLHHQIHYFFTDSWQTKVRYDERKKFFENLYIKRFGKEDYEKLKGFKAWIDESPNKSALLAYIMNNDPYKL